MIKFDHVAFVVPDISKAVEWYKETLDVTILYQDETWAIVSVYNTKIAFVLPNKHPVHVAFKINSKDDIGYLNFERDFNKHRDNSESIYLKDPFGNAIEWVIYPEK